MRSMASTQASANWRRRAFPRTTSRDCSAISCCRIPREILEQGSVGASGDLAPLAHLSGVLIGEGYAKFAGERMSARAALTRAGLHPLELEAKEGLALLNGTQVSTALALVNLFAAEANLEAALIA